MCQEERAKEGMAQGRCLKMAKKSKIVISKWAPAAYIAGRSLMGLPGQESPMKFFAVATSPNALATDKPKAFRRGAYNLLVGNPLEIITGVRTSSPNWATPISYGGYNVMEPVKTVGVNVGARIAPKISKKAGLNTALRALKSPVVI